MISWMSLRAFRFGPVFSMPLVGGASVASAAALRGMVEMGRDDDGLEDLMNEMDGFWKVAVRDNAQLLLMV